MLTFPISAVEIENLKKDCFFEVKRAAGCCCRETYCVVWSVASR
jgi:hypothetical protein